MKKHWDLSLLIIVNFLAVAVGQFLRIEIFKTTSGGLLITDLVAGITLIFLFIKLYRYPRKKLVHPVFLPLAVWLVVVLLSFLAQFFHYSAKEAFIGGSYIIRLVSYYSILVLAILFVPAVESRLMKYGAYLTVTLIALGLLILYVMPDFADLALSGWDPHVGRLTSTWLDPNFFGNFLACVFAFYLAFSAKAKKFSKYYQWFYWVFLGIIWVALSLTYSRSSVLTFAVAALLVAAYTSWRMVALILVLIVSVFAFPSRLQQRINQGFQYSISQTAVVANSGGSVAQNQAAQVDTSSNARVLSWERAFTLFKKHPILGVGYNFYGPSQIKANLIGEDVASRLRSANGSDSSLLTILATTGILGLGSFLWLWFVIVKFLWKAREQPVALGALGMTAGWFCSSFFNNTLLYPLLMVPFFFFIGVALSLVKKKI